MSHMVELSEDQVTELRAYAEKDEVDVLRMPEWMLEISTLCTRGRFNERMLFETDDRLVKVSEWDGAVDSAGDLVLEAPEGVCSHCWSKADEQVAKADDVIQDSISGVVEKEDDVSVDDFAGVPGVRYRWKPKGYARKVWWDVLVPDTAPATDVRAAVSSALGLDDGFHAWEFADNTRALTADTEVVMPDTATGTEMAADETSGGGLLDAFELAEGDRLYYLYDLSGMEVVSYGIVKERIEDCQAYIEDNEYERQVGSVFVLRGKGKRPSRYE